jgi:exonuclease SbcC
LATYEGIVPKSLNSDHYHAQEGSTSDLFWKNNADLPPCPAKPNLASWEITKELKALDSVEYLSGLTLEVEALSVEVSKGRGLQELLNKGNEYDREIARREGLMMAAEDAKDKVRELSEQLVPDEVAAQLENYNQTWRNLDVRLKEIQACKAVIESNLRVRDLMFERQEKLANYGGIVEATKATRSIVKTMLAPTLSKSATHYMSILSGYHREVQVTGDMDVLVEGQGVHSLSGSAKACADLSLRFAIADTLMKNRFPVLLCDELDASFDEQRAARITEMLKSRAEKYQVLMISHKDIESDHIVSLV